MIANFENFLVENHHFSDFRPTNSLSRQSVILFKNYEKGQFSVEISKKFEQKILEISEYLHMNPSACYGYKIKHFQVKFPQSIFILNKLWAAEQPQKWN